ncbi:unnamed protein product [Mytilus coruscus]|uniref:AIG1-type G domain-containing protein n=1 Tax=Mytilus coruscus TaxID=42192 RepID=A0A6J8ATJ0_MYTCO|nr:unnamed protein product [Mytilus coruscus]
MKTNHFQSQSSPRSVTDQCKRGDIERGLEKVIVVDTPGLFDTKTVSEEIRKEITKCITVSAPGPHAIIYVLSLQTRLTKEEDDAFAEMELMFGKELYNYVILLFTGKDMIDREIDVFLAELPPFFQKVLKKCKHRVIAFNNFDKTSDEENKIQTDNLFKMIDTITSSGKRKYFCNQFIADTEKLIKNEIEKLYQKAVSDGTSKDPNVLRSALRDQIRDNILIEGNHFKILWRYVSNFFQRNCSIL